MKKITILTTLLLICKLGYGFTADPNDSIDTIDTIDTVRFGNAMYVNLSVGEQFEYLGKSIEVVALENHLSHIKVGDEQAWLAVAKRSLPIQFGGLRIFVSDQINVKNLTTDAEKHNLLHKDVLLCISDPAKPLLNPSAFVFPISNRDGYEWTMEENSHMFAYLGLATWMNIPGYYRSHEGIDLNMHEARGKEIHPLVAIESGTVVLVADSTVTKSRDGCIILKSDTQDNIYYVYKHTNPETHKVKEGQKIKKGELLSYIWGDNVWGHLHFAIVYRTDTPAYGDRYTNLLNFFPQLYEIHFTDLAPIQKARTEGQFTFGHKKETCKNFQRLNEYSELTGYGWKLGKWCVAQKVEDAEADFGGNARLKRILHAGSEAESKNPESFYDFEVAVENGLYLVSARVGDTFEASSQKVYFEDTDAGSFEIQEAGRYEKTKDFEIQVSDNKLTVRLELMDHEKCAGINELNFKRINN